MTSREPADASDREDVDIEIDGAAFEANMVVPEGARAVVIVLGGPEADAVLGRLARDLQEARLATLLPHLGGPGDAVGRLLAVCRWLSERPRTSRLGIGLLAAGSAAGTALQAAARPEARIRAIACVDARLEAAPHADHLSVPTLMLVADEARVEAGERVLAGVAAEHELRVVKSSHRSIEERLEALAGDAIRWFRRHA